MLLSDFQHIKHLFTGGEIEVCGAINRRTLRGEISRVQVTHGRLYVDHAWMAIDADGIWERHDKAPTFNFPLDLLTIWDAHRYRANTNTEGIYCLSTVNRRGRLRREDIREPMRRIGPQLRVIK